jgi:hypothetical protein
MTVHYFSLYVVLCYFLDFSKRGVVPQHHTQTDNYNARETNHMKKMGKKNNSVISEGHKAVYKLKPIGEPISKPLKQRPNGCR